MNGDAAEIVSVSIRKKKKKFPYNTVIASPLRKRFTKIAEQFSFIADVFVYIF